MGASRGARSPLAKCRSWRDEDRMSTEVCVCVVVHSAEGQTVTLRNSVGKKIGGSEGLAR